MNLALAFLEECRHDPGAMVFDMDPIAYVEAVVVDGRGDRRAGGRAELRLVALVEIAKAPNRARLTRPASASRSPSTCFRPEAQW
jgi:hypothetical protein